MTSIQPPSTNTTNPEWNEQFDLEVQDASQSQLEVTLWQVEWKTQLLEVEHYWKHQTWSFVGAAQAQG